MYITKQLARSALASASRHPFPFRKPDIATASLSKGGTSQVIQSVGLQQSLFSTNKNHIQAAAKAIALVAAEESQTVTKKEWNKVKNQLVAKINTLEQKLVQMDKTLHRIDSRLIKQEKMKRIDYAIEQLQWSRTDYIRDYSDVSLDDIRHILIAFRQGDGYWLDNNIFNDNYHTEVQKELCDLLGVEPRLEHEKNDSGEMHWAIYYS